MQKLFGKTNYLVKLCPLDAFGLNILSFFFSFFEEEKEKRKKKSHLTNILITETLEKN